MTDVFTRKKRSWVMSRIRSKNTKMENLFESKLKENHIKYERYPEIFGRPDFLIKNKNIVIFIDGCFFHKCPKHYKAPKTKKKFWISKIEKNVKRDKEVVRRLRKEGYGVIRFWEHKIEKNVDECILKINNCLKTS